MGSQVIRRRHQGGVAGLVAAVSVAVLRVPPAVVIPVFVVVLAGIDIVGGVVAKSWAFGRDPWTFAAGIVLSALLFWVYGLSLRHGQLSTITIGWVVLVTAADLALDRWYYHVHFPLSKWLAALGAVVLLGYLLVGPDGDAPHADRSAGPLAPAAPVTTSTAAPPSAAPAAP